MHVIAADVGGTKTRLAFAAIGADTGADNDAGRAQKVLYEARYLSGDFESFEPMLRTFIRDSESAGNLVDTTRIDALTLALPGLVNDSSARLTNLPWTIEKQSLKAAFGVKDVYFMNDFQASAFGTGVLQDKDRVILNPGSANPDALRKNTTRIAVGAGTGLGVAWAEVAVDNESASDCNAVDAHDTEGGHIDFAPADDTQIKLLKFLQQRHGHVSYERILSGDGLVSLYQFCSGELCLGNISGNLRQNIDAEWVNRQSKNDQAADEALSLFVQIYGAYIGNIALLFKPYGGIYITGGIAAKMLKRMQSEEFINAYLNKGRMRALVEQIAVYLVTNERVGVLGAISETIKRQQISARQK